MYTNSHKDKHESEHGRVTVVKGADGHTPDRTTAPALTTAPDRTTEPPARLRDLSGLQDTVGHAAVVQMLRRAGHPWAQEEQPHTDDHDLDHDRDLGHDHDHQRAEPAVPSVQRSAVHNVLRSPGRPLDSATRSDMEARLGADFSDVRIHSGAAAKASAAEVGARAYTSGSHVVIGDGGTDKHTLAHELTHVIQQRQGPVSGTDNGSGLRVSDPSDRFEREAEQVARTALAQPTPGQGPHPAADASRAAPAQPGTALVQRALATQITASGKEGEEEAVGDVIFFGRPESTHSQTAGDHGTAYVVVHEGVRNKIRGKNAKAAGEEVYQLFKQAQQTAAANLAEGEEQWNKNEQLMKEESTELERLNILRTSESDENWGMSGLQEMINAYLQYQDALPLSTFNTKGKKKSGKGDGESRHHRALLGYPDNNLTKDELQTSILALLDIGAVRYYMEKQEKTDETKIVDIVTNRHIAEIAGTYGDKVITGAWADTQGASKVITAALRGEESTNNPAPSTEKVSGKDDEAAGQPKMAVQIVTKDDGTIDKLLSEGRPLTQFASSEGNGGHTIAWTVHIDYVEACLKGKTATQAIHDELDGLVSHVGALTQGLNSPALEDAFSGFRMGPRRSNRAPKPVKKYAALEENDALREADKAVQETLENNTKTADERMTNAVKAATEGNTILILALQAAVSAILARINLIPGTAYLGLSSKGDAEGIHRGYLKGKRAQTHPKNTTQDKEDSRKSIFGLLQIPRDHDDSKRIALMDQHLSTVKIAYPDAYNAAEFEKDSTEEILKEYRSTKDNKKGGDPVFGPP
ncbi:DUF4157 domain-containing protein [Streptomyces sp. NPDC014734]|uniref:eCIS core domain-containing protein n=1 Tax=Streptomyces sp. NPDC014734 TaxID=3364886 RepID=UPI0036FC581D